jgi:cyclopropane-fatty-acyl-phospholipid synthase
MPTSYLPWRTAASSGSAHLRLADVLDLLTDRPVPFRFTAYDGSATGPREAPIALHLRTPRGAAYLATAPGSLGMARAYVSGDLVVEGVHPGDPYDALVALEDGLGWRRPEPRTVSAVVRSLGVTRLVPPPPPPQEALSDWRRALEGLRHSRRRDAAAIHHHYDVSNTFYEYLLGPSMAYTCAVYPTDDATLEQAQEAKFDLVARKLALREGARLLDVGCGWGGMAMHAARRYGVHVVAVTLSREQAEWGARAVRREGLQDLIDIRHGDYRDVAESGFDAVSSIGLTEHIGVRNYPAYFAFLRDRLRPGGRLLNHCITRPENTHRPRVRDGFIDRYVFPDGELTGSGRIITEVQNVGLEVFHEENLREHYARTCGAWCQNLVKHWDVCVEEVGEATARVWGLYLAGSRLGFERNRIQLHQVLAVRPHADGGSGMPLRPDWVSP